MTKDVSGPPFTVERYGSLAACVIAERDCYREMLIRARNSTIPHGIRYDIDRVLDGAPVEPATSGTMISRLEQMMDENDGVHDEEQLGYFRGVRDALAVVRNAVEPTHIFHLASPSALCPLIGCKNRDPHTHGVAE